MCIHIGLRFAYITDIRKSVASDEHRAYAAATKQDELYERKCQLQYILVKRRPMAPTVYCQAHCMHVKREFYDVRLLSVTRVFCETTNLEKKFYLLFMSSIYA